MKKTEVMGTKEYFEMKNNSIDQPLTLRNFIRFYEDRMEPRFARIEDGFTKSENDNKTKFDFLYKTYEDLKQEYRIICHQIKRTEKKIEAFESKNGQIDSKYFFGEKFLENPAQELADIKFRLECAQGLLRKCELQFNRLKKNRGNQEEKRDLGWDLRVLKSMIQGLIHRIEKLEK